MQLVVPRGGDGTTSVDGRSKRLGGWLRRRGLIPDGAGPALASAAPGPAATALGTAEPGATPPSAPLERTRVSVRGTVGDVTVRTRSGWPRLEVELTDGTDTVLLVWMGRRRVTGVEPGRSVAADGMLVRRGSRCVIFNPSYELLP